VDTGQTSTMSFPEFKTWSLISMILLVCLFLILDVSAMKHTKDKPRQCYTRHKDYRWRDGEMPGDPEKKNPNFNKHCSMRLDPGDPSHKSIDIAGSCVLENCTDEQTTCVRNIKVQEKNDSTMVILEGCDKPPKEVPDMDEKNEYGMAGKLWEEYCENLLINHMRPVYKVSAYRCYCPNHRDDESQPCNKAKPLQTDRIAVALSFVFNLLLFHAIR